MPSSPAQLHNSKIREAGIREGTNFDPETCSTAPWGCRINDGTRAAHRDHLLTCTSVSRRFLHGAVKFYVR